MLERVLGIITRYSMFRQGDHVGVAVSGGADSVCLLHVLLELGSRWDLRFHVLHLDHGLRGEESRGDAEFVRELAQRLGLPCVVESADVAEIRQQTGDNLEQSARRVRNAFFQRVLQSGVVDRIATGHTRSDQAETVLFRFLRGAGTAGLCGVLPVTAEGLVRPLLDIERAEVETYLQERDISWREDATNQTMMFARNRIRWELMPKLAAEWNPSITATLAHTADWALAEEQYWDGEIDRIADLRLISNPPVVLMSCAAWRDLPLAAARRLVRRALQLVKGDLLGIGFQHVEYVVGMAGAAEGSGRVQLPGVDVYRSFEWIRFAPPGLDRLENRNFAFPLDVPGQVRLPGGGAVRLENVLAGSGYNEKGDYVNRDRLTSGLLEVRNWRPGDQYHPFGHSGSEKIKTLFQQARIPLWERRNWPVITDGASIVWSRRFGVGVDYAADPNSRAILRIREVGL